jgi:hypothetical protein
MNKIFFSPKHVRVSKSGLLFKERRGLTNSGHFHSTGGDSIEHSLANWPSPPHTHVRTRAHTHTHTDSPTLSITRLPLRFIGRLNCCWPRQDIHSWLQVSSCSTIKFFVLSWTCACYRSVASSSTREGVGLTN